MPLTVYSYQKHMEHLLKTRKGRLKFGTYHVQLESGRFAQWFAIFVNPNFDGSPNTSWSPNALYSPTFWPTSMWRGSTCTFTNAPIVFSFLHSSHCAFSLDKDYDVEPQTSAPMIFNFMPGSPSFACAWHHLIYRRLKA